LPINLRYRLKLISDARLAAALEANLAKFDAEKAVLNNQSRWSFQLWPVHDLRRTFIRHRLAYRVKGLFFSLFEFLDSPPWSLVLIPAVAWLIGPANRKSVGRSFSTYLLRCEVEDLMDEAQRRVEARQRRYRKKFNEG
jgi:hypothetical protein